MDGVIPQAVRFATFGTVVDWRSGIAAAVSELAGPVDPLAFADARRARHQPGRARA
jgi:2-haloacid dehalogenase